MTMNWHKKVSFIIEAGITLALFAGSVYLLDKIVKVLWETFVK